MAALLVDPNFSVDAIAHVAQVTRLRLHPDANLQARALFAMRAIRSLITRAGGVQPLTSAYQVASCKPGPSSEDTLTFLKQGFFDTVMY